MTPYDVPPLTIAKRDPDPTGSSLSSSALLTRLFHSVVAAKIGENVEDPLGRGADQGRRRGTQRRNSRLVALSRALPLLASNDTPVTLAFYEHLAAHPCSQ